MIRLYAVVAALFVLTFATPARGDEVTAWSQMMFRASFVAGTSPLVITRSAAIVHAAMFDAVNGIEGRYAPFHVTQAAPAGASRNAAAAQAAYTAIVALFPAQKPLLDTKLAASMAAFAAHETAASIASGVAWGQTVANAILALRATDGFTTVLPPFFGNPIVGVWRSTPPGNLPFAGQQFSTMTPWVIPSPDEFRPGLPPALTSAQYTADFNEVKNMGRSNSTLRKPDQTIFSWFWNTSTASAIWNNVAVTLIEQADDRGDHDRWEGDGWDKGREDQRGGQGHHPSLLENARLLALLNLSMADAAIGCWDAKWIHMYWRPVTAIVEAAADGNPLTAPDATWTPLFATPAHSEYPSGHSCVSGAAGLVLTSFFGNRTPLAITSDAMPGVVRSFRTLSAALEEVKNARIYAGIHFRTATNVGQSLGQSVGEFVLENALRRAH